MNYCECGCGIEIPWYNSFVQGHQFTGRKHDDETRQRMSKIVTEAMANPEVRLRMSEVQTGKKHTDETKQAISEAGIGRKHTAEELQKMSKGQKLSIARDKIADAPDEATKERILAGLYSRDLISEIE